MPVFEIEEWPQWHISEWRQFYQMRPFGSWRDNFHAGLIAKTIADVNRPANKPPYPLENFFYMDAHEAEEKRKERDRRTFESISAYVDSVKKNGS